MTRRALAPSFPLTYWDGIESAVFGLVRMAAALAERQAGVDTLERANLEVRMTARHWLMG
jgi:hypothetical protein